MGPPGRIDLTTNHMSGHTITEVSASLAEENDVT